MAKFAWKTELLIQFTLIFLTLIGETDGKRTKNKIYVDLQTQNACFRSMNATHQVGCSSAEDGNVGVLHYLETAEDYDWVMRDGPNPPYVVLMSSVEFNSSNLDQLVGSGRVNGILVINILENDTITPIPSELSADKSCPNDAYGLYHGNKNYSQCQKQEWNVAGTPTGMFFKDYSIPMFSLPNVTDVNKLITMCYEKFNRPVNGSARSYPLCAVEMKGWMIGAKDTVTCVRRSGRVTNLSNPVTYCDPLGDRNIVATVKNNNTGVRPNDSVIVFAARMDSFSMFYNEYPSADTTVTGIVTLLAVAEAIGKVQELQAVSAKDIMFVLFQGEAFDYIGSSRMVYDMLQKNSQFPHVSKTNMTVGKIALPNIHSFVELGQVGLRDQGKLWIHSDPVTRSKVDQPNVMPEIINLMKSSESGVNVDIDEVTGDVPLPPASVQRFLMERPIPALLVSDHQREFSNKYYNGRFDLPGLINVTEKKNQSDTETDSQTTELTDLATALARMLYNVSTGQTAPDTIKADETKVEALLQCFLYNQLCELFRRSVEPEDAKNLEKAKKPFPFYVSVPRTPNQVTSLTYSILSQYLGQEVNLTKAECKSNRYLYIQGNRDPSNPAIRLGACIKSTANLTMAKSPAFDIEDYDWLSGKYSTWTESVWDPLRVRIFLVPSQQFQVLTLCVGLGILLLSMIIVFIVNGSADVIFTSDTIDEQI